MQYNNKFERLLNKKIIIGIDIAKHEHYASITEKETGRILKTGIKMTNKEKDFKKLINLAGPYKKEEILMGMEPTGLYWKVPNNWFVSEGYETVIVNPYHVKLSKEIHNNLNNKNDKKDSQVIAELIRNGKFLDVLTIEENYDELRQLTLTRDTLVKDLTREKIRLITLLDEFLPEYANCFREPARVTSLSLLKKYLLSGLSNNKNKKQKANLIFTISRGAIGREKAKNIVETLSKSIGIKSGVNSAEYRLKLIIEKITYLVKKIGEIEAEMKVYLYATSEAKYMLSMPGIGVVTLSGFLGCTGCLEKFSHPMQLQKFAGMLPSQQKSGKFEGLTKLSKRGNGKLRNVMHRIAISLVSSNFEFKKLYKYKLEELNKIRMVGLTAIAAKALRILYRLGRDKKFYEKKFVLDSIVKF